MANAAHQGLEPHHPSDLPSGKRATQNDDIGQYAAKFLSPVSKTNKRKKQEEIKDEGVGLHTGEVLSLFGARGHPLRLVWQKGAVCLGELGLTQVSLFGDQSRGM